MVDKILLVDDNADLLLIAQIILKGQGLETVLAANIEEAERKIQIHQPTLILLDVNLCNQDGREFCNQLKFDPLTSDIRIILMSGDCDKLEHTAADDVLAKPFDFNDFVEKVQRQLSLVH